MAANTDMLEYFDFPHFKKQEFVLRPRRFNSLTNVANDLDVWFKTEDFEKPAADMKWIVHRYTLSLKTLKYKW